MPLKPQTYNCARCNKVYQCPGHEYCSGYCSGCAAQIVKNPRYDLQHPILHDKDKIPGIGSLQDLMRECGCWKCVQLQGTKVTIKEWHELHPPVTSKREKI